MAKIISTQQVGNVTINKQTERQAIRLTIELDPRYPITAVLSYADTVSISTTDSLSATTVDIQDVIPIESIGLTNAEVMALTSFPGAYAEVKTLSDAKLVEKWPDL